jgi:hypothetical protein
MEGEAEELVNSVTHLTGEVQGEREAPQLDRSMAQALPAGTTSVVPVEQLPVNP